MNDRQIDSFIQLVKSNSFSKAEEQLFISRQALKKQIDSLETEIGFDLFLRNYKGVTLTPAGELFYERIQGLHNEIHSLISECRDISHHDTVIRIGNPNQPHLILEKTFAKFAENYPDIQLDIKFLRETGTIDSVKSGAVDISEHIFSSAAEAEKSGVEYYKLCDMPYFCLVASSHPFASKQILKPEEFKNHEITVRKYGNRNLIDSIVVATGGWIKIHETEHDDEQNIITTCFNHGIYITRKKRENFSDALIAVPIATNNTNECCIIWRKNPQPIVKDFVKIAKQIFPPSH